MRILTLRCRQASHVWLFSRGTFGAESLSQMVSFMKALCLRTFTTTAPSPNPIGPIIRNSSNNFAIIDGSEEFFAVFFFGSSERITEKRRLDFL